MFCTLALATLAFADASRIHIHEHDASSETTQWGASCDDLQTNFRSRVAGFHTQFEGIEDYNTVSRWSQARLMMRAYGIIRTVRRAEGCSWVEDDSTEDIDALRGVVASLMSNNPCTEAAAAQLNADTSDESTDDELHSIESALWVLTSDDCNTDVPREEIAAIDADRAARENEDALVDGIERLEEEAESSLLQTESDSKFIVALFRFVGIAILLVFFAMACTSAMTMVGFALGFLLLAVQNPATPINPIIVFAPIIGLYGGMGFGLLGCLYRTMFTLLPQLAGSSAPAVQ